MKIKLPAFGGALFVLLVAVACSLRLSTAQTPPAATAPAAGPEPLSPALLAQAPRPNIAMPGMKLELVDFIDSTSAAEKHPFKEDGWSTVVTGPTGLKYRETAPTAHSFFSYQFSNAGINVPHLVVVEYPDDKERVCSLSMQEDWMTPRYDAGGQFHIQEGYYSGAALPLSGRYCYQKLFFCPASKAPALLVLNVHNTMPAAISRIWVYKITEGPKPPVINEPAGPRRAIGEFMEDFRAIRYQFGKSGDAMQNYMDYLKYSGQNVASIDSMIYGYSYCNVEALGGTNNDMTETILTACDKNGIQFIAVMDPGRTFKISGIPTGDLNDEKIRQAWINAIKEFVERYGKHPSLKGISFGGPALGGPITGGAKEPTDREKIGELHQGLNKMLQEIRPDLTLYFYASHRALHRTIFNDKGHQPHKDIIAPWENSQATFREVLLENVKKYYAENHINPADFTHRKGLSVVREYYPNDDRLFRFYQFRTNNYMMFRDYAWEDGISEFFQNGNQNGACLFGTYFEISTPVFAGINYWWSYSGVGSQINPAEPYFKESYTNALAQDDVPFIINSSWCDPTNGSADLVREFATSFRTLPAERFRTVAKDNYVVVRELAAKDGAYFYILNNHWSPAEVTLSLGSAAQATNLVTNEPASVGPQKAVFRLKPYELQTFKMPAANPITQTAVTRTPESYAHLQQRIEEFNSRLQRLEANHVPVSPRYAEVYKQAAGLFDSGKYEQADRTLGFALSQELLLRLHVAVDRPKAVCKKVDRPVTLDDGEKLSDATNTLELNGMANLMHDFHYLNLWHGPKDLSCKALLNHDGQNIYIRFFVTDDRVMKMDEIGFQFNTDGGYASTAEKGGFAKFAIPAPVDAPEARGPNYVVRKTPTGYEGVFTVPLKQLNVKPGAKIGLHVSVIDMDLDSDIWYDRMVKEMHWPWVREKVMEWPPNPYWLANWNAQSCGEVQLEEK